MTTKQLKIPPDIAEGIKKIAKEKKLTTDQLLKDLMKVMKEDAVVSKLKDPDMRIQAAWGILASSYVSIGGATKEVIIQPFAVSTVRQAGKTNKDICVILGAVHSDNEKPVFGKLVAWEEQAHNIESLEPDVCYKLKARITKTKLGVSGTIDSESMIREVERELVDELDFFKALYEDPNRRCTIADALNNCAALKDDLDIRVIMGTIVSASPTRNGESAVINIIDNTFTSAERMNGFTVYGSLDQLKGGVGSKGYFAGKIGVRDRSAEHPEAVMRNGIFAPIFTTEYIEE